MKPIAPLLLSAAFVLLAGCSHSASSNAPAHASVGAMEPSWSERTDKGSMLSSSSLLGKPVYVNFFASWCPPCNDEAPDIEALSKRYASRGLQVVGVDVMENADKAALFGREHNLTYPLVVDDGTLRDAYQLNGLPVHVFIDADGTVHAIRIGELTKAEMVRNIRAILPSKGHA
uniref:Putative Peroxiredoxin n=1 Tax=mine drainage metagenome TaxID=410659 RepID=E6Q7X3_9ZZZZ